MDPKKQISFIFVFHAEGNLQIDEEKKLHFCACNAGNDHSCFQTAIV